MLLFLACHNATAKGTLWLRQTIRFIGGMIPFAAVRRIALNGNLHIVLIAKK